MRRKKTVFFLLSALLLLLPWESNLHAKKKCPKKKKECKDGSEKVTDCCSSSQICKNGTCFYPGELELIEKKKAAIKAKKETKKKESEGKAKEDNTQRIKLLGDMLLQSKDFKVRVQAAFSLAKIKDTKIIPYLKKGLKDKHPAVRSASATALGRTGDPAALDVLYKMLDKDPNSMVDKAVKDAILQIESDPSKLGALKKAPEMLCDVPHSKVKYLFVIGSMNDKAGAKRDDLHNLFKLHLSHKLKSVGRSMVVTNEDVPKEVLKRIKKGKAHGFAFNASLNKLDGGWDGKRGYVMTAKISIVCLKYPSQVLAMTMSSAASSTITKSGFRKKLIPKLEEDAIKGAIDSMAASVEQNLDRLTGKKKKKK